MTGCLKVSSGKPNSLTRPELNIKDMTINIIAGSQKKIKTS